jgi:hypothetical protein
VESERLPYKLFLPIPPSVAVSAALPQDFFLFFHKPVPLIWYFRLFHYAANPIADWFAIQASHTAFPPASVSSLALDWRDEHDQTTPQ